jgi:hypothetical protein
LIGRQLTAESAGFPLLAIPIPNKTKNTLANGITTPFPIQTGMVTNCDKFHKYVKGEGYCADLANANHITLDQFYAWNLAVGSNCGFLFPDYWYCVSIIGVD